MLRVRKKYKHGFSPFCKICCVELVVRSVSSALRFCEMMGRGCDLNAQGFKVGHGTNEVYPCIRVEKRANLWRSWAGLPLILVNKRK